MVSFRREALGCDGEEGVMKEAETSSSPPPLNLTLFFLLFPFSFPSFVLFCQGENQWRESFPFSLFYFPPRERES